MIQNNKHKHTPDCINLVRGGRNDISSILVIRMNKLGDMICTIPLLKTLRQEFPDARLSVLAESTNAEILKHASFLDQVLVYKKKDGLAGNRFFEVKRILKGARFDLCIGVKAGFSSSLAAMAFLSKAKNRVGFISNHFHVANALYNIPVKKSVARKHQILQCLDLLGAIGVPAEKYDLDCTIDIPLASEARFAAFLDVTGLVEGDMKRVVINISNNKPESTWPTENFIELIKRLSKIGVRCIITSSPDDRTKVDMITSACGPSILAFETPQVMDFAAAVKNANLLICHDSGAMHIGSAAGTRTLVLVGRGITPEVWGPYGEGHKCIKKKSIFDISPDEVINEAKTLLNGSIE